MFIGFRFDALRAIADELADRNSRRRHRIRFWLVLRHSHLTDLV